MCRRIAQLGAAHGDLHPRNIIVGDIQKACLIDFGWAASKFPVIVDFVLMEISIKFFYMPWAVSRSALLKYEHLLTQDFHIRAKVNDPILDGSLNVIKVVRRLAETHLKKTESQWFACQYLLPMFFLTMGTFAFASTVTNLEHLILSAGLIGSKLETSLGI